jgi:hypothetical protein
LLRQFDVALVADDTGLRGTVVDSSVGSVDSSVGSVVSSVGSVDSSVGSVVSSLAGLAPVVVVTATFAGVLGLVWHGGLVVLSGVVDLPVVTLGVAERGGVRPLVRGVPVL